MSEVVFLSFRDLSSKMGSGWEFSGEVLHEAILNSYGSVFGLFSALSVEFIQNCVLDNFGEQAKVHKIST